MRGRDNWRGEPIGAGFSGSGGSSIAGNSRSVAVPRPSCRAVETARSLHCGSTFGDDRRTLRVQERRHMPARFLVGTAAIATLAATVDLGAQQRAAQAPVRTITITVSDPVGDKMEYSVKQIVAKPGERLRIRLVSVAQTPKIVMAHNWVLLKLGTDPKAFTDAAANARATDFIPPALKHQILAEMPLAGPGERFEMTFTVPKVPGKYFYVCTFAGHYAAGMWGVLIVK
jgi:azurin